MTLPLLRETAVFSVTLVVAAAFWVQSYADRFPNNVFPRLVIVLVAALAGINLLKTLIESRSRANAAERPPVVSRAVLIGIGGTLLYLGGIIGIGFYPATALYLAAMYAIRRSSGRPRLGPTALALAGGVTVTILIYGVFTMVLGVQTPGGYLGSQLGL